MPIGAELKIFGVRGSTPLSKKQYSEFGGNTASYTLRTTSNSLIFLDAGSGILFAENELDKVAKSVWLIISHTHADHILGFGMTRLPFLDDQKSYSGKKLKIIGPNKIYEGLHKFYDGEVIWPVKFGKSSGSNSKQPTMSGIDYENIIEFKHDYQTINIDETTKVELMRGNHPVKECVNLVKFVLRSQNQQKIIVYATDNEFDYTGRKTKNKNAELDKEKYIKFIENADLLIADGQYTKEDYSKKRGYGHSYPEQIIELATKAYVKSLLITHHHNYTDNEMRKREDNLNEKLKTDGINMKFSFAREGMNFVL
ncbi:MAG: MBL fold metallo-hydrolase [Candidatus Kariarchaeaceae archaeon]|jgi:ribonuclease BN (tRNA processing enzyme)